jgi:VWFA-related protein
MSRASVILLIVLVSSLIVVAQDSPQRGDLQKQNKDFVLNVDTTLVQLPVSVLDREGHPVNGLTKENFQVFEDNVEQNISLFKHEDVPISLGLVIDNSGSMRNKRERVNSAALTFVRESNPEDETFIVNFDDSAYLEQDFTGSIGDLIDALDNLDTRGETALYDAIYLSVGHVQEGHRDKKALLLVSDGEDNKSKYDFEKALKELRGAHVTLYAIGLLEENDQRGGLFKKPPSKRAKDELMKFAEATGGAAYFPKTIDEVEELCKQIAHNLRNHYTIGYNPTNKKLDGTWRKVDVRVSPKASPTKLNVTYKTGYYAPSETTAGNRPNPQR